MTFILGVFHHSVQQRKAREESEWMNINYYINMNVD